MINKKLPIRLNKEPLIDVVCAVHFTSDVPTENLLPGLLISKISIKDLKIEPLAAAKLPQVVRDSDPSFKNAPLMRITIDDKHFVMIGSNWMAVGCNIPYSGWSDYKKTIKSVFSILSDAGFIKLIDSYSLKYVDFIEDQECQPSVSVFDLDIKIAGNALKEEQTQLRTEIVDSEFLHVITIISKASLEKPGKLTVEGSLIDVDTHRVGKIFVNEFNEKLDTLLDEIHIANKQIFFNILSDDGLMGLEPIYE